MRMTRMSILWVRRGLAKSGSSAPPPPSPTPSITPPASASVTCRSPWISCCRETAAAKNWSTVSHGRPLVLPSGAGQSQGGALVTPAGVLLPCPDQIQVGEALMTKEAEAFCTINSDQRAFPPDPPTL